MHLVYMHAKAHDVHVAYVSHISSYHIFCISKYSIGKRKGRDNISELASTGSESTVRSGKK
jgi:prephenate dehydrogenase